MKNELTILIAEDDAFQRRLVVQMLHSLGISSVLEAENGNEALHLLLAAQEKTPVDIVISDLSMPEMDGLEFLRHIGEEKLNVGIVINSGLDRRLLSSAGRMTKMYGMRLLGVMEKPFQQIQLAALLEKHQQFENKWRVQNGSTVEHTLAEILTAMEAQQFEPYFQPQINLKTGRLVGAEALARWRHPKRGIVAPCDFIPLLEHSGHIDKLTLLMLEQSVAACRALHDKDHPINISVNLSLAGLSNTRLAEQITQVVKKLKLDPQHVTLEITESAAMTNIGQALENLTRLCMNGFALSIDDYGTGYSSMQQLTRIAFSELKIDGSFVTDLADNEMLRIIVDSCIDMAHKLEVKSTAEGVETQQDLDVLKTMGCDTGQGYFIARPMDLASFIAFCVRQNGSAHLFH